MELPVTHSVCAEVQKKGALWRKREAIGKMPRRLRKWKGLEIHAAEIRLARAHMLAGIPPKMSDFMESLKGKSGVMLYAQFGELKYKRRNRAFRRRGIMEIRRNISGIHRRMA